jgi:AcrR family transcriptional regulator
VKHLLLFRLSFLVKQHDESKDTAQGKVDMYLDQLLHKQQMLDKVKCQLYINKSERRRNCPVNCGSEIMVEQQKVDKRILRTRQGLSKAFLEVLEEKGFQKMTVQDITARANVNRATFYAHYEDKYDLFSTIIDYSFQQKIDSKIPANAEFNLGNLRTLILAVLEYLGQLNAYYARAETDLGPVIETRIQSKIYEVVLNWLRKAQPSQMKLSSAPDITAAVVSWSIFGAGMKWSRDRLRYPAEQVADHTLLLIAGGLYGSLIG